MNDEVVRADPVLRKRAVAILLGAGVVGAAALQWGLPWLELARLRQPGMQRTICISFLGVIIGWTLVVLALALPGLGSYALAVLWPR